MHIIFFFRKQQPCYHSIEELFDNVQQALPKEVRFSDHYVKYKSKGFIKRLLNTFEVFFHQKDVNHVTGDIYYVTLFLRKKKTLITVHDIGEIYQDNKLKGKLIKFFWYYLPSNRVKYVTVVSEFSKNQLINDVKVDPKKIIVIPNCVSPLIRYEPKQFNKEKPTLLQIGTKKNKNLLRLIKAIKDINCKLIIIGQLTSDQLVMLKDCKIDYQNFYNIKYKQVIELYLVSDLLTFVSTYEGFGIPVIEANATGRAVITSNISSMPEVANDAALLVDPYSVEEIRNAVLKLINNDQLREELIKKGLENVKRFQADVIANKYYELYKKISGI